jgi:hypothetical protein
MGAQILEAQNGTITTNGTHKHIGQWITNNPFRLRLINPV